MQTTFFYLEKLLKKLADNQCSSISKGSIYHIKHMYIQPFTTIVDWLVSNLTLILHFYLVRQYPQFHASLTKLNKVGNLEIEISLIET